MQNNFEASLALILKVEAGFSNNPEDPGGMTNLGVTKRTWEAFVGHPVTEADMRALTPEQVRTLYKQMFWDAVKGDELPLGIDYATADFAVNSSPARAAGFLQTAVRMFADHKIGPHTLAVVGTDDPAAVINHLCDYRMVFLRSLKDWPEFGKGWNNRVFEVRAAALAMVPKPETPAIGG